MIFDKLFVLSFAYFLFAILQIFSMAESEEVLSPTTSIQESQIHTLGKLTQVTSNSSRLTPDKKLKVELIKICEQKNKILKKVFSLSILLVASNKTLEAMEFEEESTPKLFVSSTNHVVLQRGQKYNLKQLIQKSPNTVHAKKDTWCAIL